MRLIFGVLRDCPAGSGASNPPTFTPQSLTQPFLNSLDLWQHRLIVMFFPAIRNRNFLRLNYIH